MDILKKAQRMIDEFPLCDHCLGRQFALLGHGLTNRDRGRTIKLLLTMQSHQKALIGDKKALIALKKLATNGNFQIARGLVEKMSEKPLETAPFTCYLCQNRFEKVDKLAERAVKMLAGYEYETFLVGVKLPAEIEEREDEFKAKFEVNYGESMRNHFSREIGKRIAELTEKPADLKNPNIVILVNPFKDKIKLQVNPLFIYGRYHKLVRDIPQSKWVCMNCRGRGCPKCNWTGKMYPESVAELISAPVLEATGGETTAFHAAGREDIDARMLGRGRPFVIEVKKPKRRFIDLEELEKAINEYAKGKVEVLDLCLVSRKKILEIKRGEGAQKVYRVLVELDREISEEEIAKLKEALTNRKVVQRTPLRVLHRRANLIREKYIYETKVKKLTSKRIEMEIRCQGGLYIKELVTGDEGRTKPSVSEILGVKAIPLALDVLDVIMEGN